MTIEEAPGGIHGSVDRVEEIDRAGAFQDQGDPRALFEGEAAAGRLVDGKADADEEILSHRLPDGLVDHEHEPAPVLQATAEAIGAPVGDGGEELPEQMARGKRFDAVEPAILAPPRRARIGVDDAVDVVLVHFLRNAAMERFPHGGRGDGGEPFVGVRVPPAAQMRDLAHRPRAVIVDSFAEALQVRDYRVGADIELAKDVGGIHVDIGRPRREPTCQRTLSAERCAVAGVQAKS